MAVAGLGGFGREAAVCQAWQPSLSAQVALADPFSGTMRLGVTPTVGPYLLPDLVPIIRSAYPRLTVQWTEERTPALVRMINDGQVDAAIVALDTGLAHMEHRRLSFDPFVISGRRATRSRPTPARPD